MMAQMQQQQQQQQLMNAGGGASSSSSMVSPVGRSGGPKYGNPTSVVAAAKSEVQGGGAGPSLYGVGVGGGGASGLFAVDKTGKAAAPARRLEPVAAASSSAAAGGGNGQAGYSAQVQAQWQQQQLQLQQMQQCVHARAPVARRRGPFG